MIDKRKIEKEILTILNEISKSNVSQINDVDETVCEIQNSIENNEFRITVVGEFSSGKSTFLNAFIGKDILPSALSETTAAITYIHNVSKDSPKLNQVVVNLQGGEHKQFDITNNEEFIQYSTTSTFSQKDVAKSVESIDVYVHFAYTEERVVLIDTPGLNGMKQGHRDITLEEIEHSHASICLFQIKGIGQTDVDFMKILMSHQKKFFFVINGIDMLKEDEGETPEKKLKDFREDIKNNFYEGKTNPELVYGISALKALVARDNSIKKLYQNDLEELTDDKRKVCLHESGMPELESKLYAFLNSDELNITFYASLVERLNSLLVELKDTAEFDEQFHQAKVDEDPDKKRWEKLRNEVKPKIDEFRTKLQSKVRAKIEELESVLQKVACKDVNAEFLIIQNSVNAINDVDSMKAFIASDIVNKKINAFDVKERSDLKKSIELGVAKIYDDIFAEIRRRIPTFSISSDKKVVVHTEGLRMDEASYSIFTDNYKQKEKELNDAQQEVKNIGMRMSNVKETENKLSVTNNELSHTKRVSSQEISRLGCRPTPNYKQVPHVHKKGLGSRIFGCIKSLFGGSYESTYTTYTTEIDDSNVRKWENERAAIDNRYSLLMREQEQKVAHLNSLLRGDSSEELKERLKRENAKIDRIRKAMEREREIQEEKIRNSKSQYIREAKSKIIEQVFALFRVVNPRGHIILNYYSGLQNVLNMLAQDMTRNIEQTYDNRVKDFFLRIDSMIRKCQNTTDSSQDAKELERLRNNITKINKWINQLTILSNELR